MKDAVQILNENLSERVSRNSAYTLSAYARDLGISAQQLSNVLNGKRGMSIALAEKITERLDLNNFEKQLFVLSLRLKFSRNKQHRAIAKAKLQGLAEAAPTRNLEIDLFRAISGWQHFTLIELIKMKSRVRKSVEWYAKKLDLPENEVRLSLERLERLELIQKDKNGWVTNQDVTIADQGIASDAIRKYHHQILEKSMVALTTQNSKERYGSSSTFSVSARSLERAKTLIQEFRIKFDQEISEPEEGEDVYALSLQYFRLTKQNQEN